MIKLSILIPTLTGRAAFLARLLNLLRPQLTDEVEVLTDIDSGERTIGEKRNRLIARAHGEYTVFIDDDDRVTEDYIEEIMVGINKGVDVVSLIGTITVDGKDEHMWFDRPYRPWLRANDGNYIRGVQHLDAIKRSITSRFKFEQVNFGEDKKWDDQIEAARAVSSYHQVSTPIYHYDFRNTKGTSFSIVIPSKNPTNLIACIGAILKHEPGILPGKIVVVDDDARSWSEGSLPAGIKWVSGIKPFVFARNINLGLANTDEGDDVILLNDDAILKTPGGFTNLVQVAQGYGLVSAATNVVGTDTQIYRGETGIRAEGRHLAFVCICIPAATLEAVGTLDPRFVDYGWEDNDYCRRVREYGLRMGTFDGCFVDHKHLTSTFRGSDNHIDIAPGRDIYVAKWGNDR